MDNNEASIEKVIARRSWLKFWGQPVSQHIVS